MAFPPVRHLGIPEKLSGLNLFLTRSPVSMEEAPHPMMMIALIGVLVIAIFYLSQDMNITTMRRPSSTTSMRPSSTTMMPTTMMPTTMMTTTVSPTGMIRTVDPIDTELDRIQQSINRPKAATISQNPVSATSTRTTTTSTSMHPSRCSCSMCTPSQTWLPLERVNYAPYDQWKPCPWKNPERWHLQRPSLMTVPLQSHLVLDDAKCM